MNNILNQVACKGIVPQFEKQPCPLYASYLQKTNTHTPRSPRINEKLATIQSTTFVVNELHKKNEK
jgi:hypothetical protein